MVLTHCIVQEPVCPVSRRADHDEVVQQDGGRPCVASTRAGFTTVIEVATLGSEVPAATMVRQMTNGEIPNDSASLELLRTSRAAPAMNASEPPANIGSCSPWPPFLQCRHASRRCARRLLRPACAYCGRGGTLFSLGVYFGDLKIPLDAFAAGLDDHKIITTLCPCGKKRMRGLMSVIQARRLDLGPMATH